MTYRGIVPGLRRSLTAALGIVLTAGVLASPTGGSPVTLFPTGGTAYAATSLVPAEIVVPFEAQMLTLVNADRAVRGLLPLQLDPLLAAVARGRSEDMAMANYFSHDVGNIPGQRVFQVLQDRGVTYQSAGENLARYYLDQAEPTKAAQTALMASPMHRANIVRPDYTHLGVGVAVTADGRVIYTQLFKAAVLLQTEGVVTYAWSREMRTGMGPALTSSTTPSKPPLVMATD